MFRFEYPEYLQLFWAIPGLLALLVSYQWWRRRALARTVHTGALPRLLPGWSALRFFIKNGLILLAIALLALAWANPQRGAKKQSVSQKSADVLIALDISQSMFVKDVAPSRLELAKSFVRKLIEALRGERIGLLFFAGDAFLQMPLSTDYAAADMFVSNAHPDLITAQGTAIPRAIDLATESFDPDPGAGRALVLITDGENHDADALARAAEAFDDGIVIFTVGAGTPAGGPIPLEGLNASEPFKRDENGALVRSRMNPSLLKDIASKGGGASYLLTQGDEAVRAIRREVDRLQKREMEVRSFSTFESYYQWFLLPAFLLLALEAWLAWRRS